MKSRKFYVTTCSYMNAVVSPKTNKNYVCVKPTLCRPEHNLTGTGLKEHLVIFDDLHQTRNTSDNFKRGDRCGVNARPKRKRCGSGCDNSYGRTAMVIRCV